MKNINLSFSLKNKKILVIGGSGLLGKKIVYDLLKLDAKVYVLDVKKSKIINKNFFYHHFDCSQIDSIESSLDFFYKNYGLPDCLINCSYPKTFDWKDNSYSKIKLNSYRKNIDIHLNSFIWIAYLVAEKMKKNSIKGSIIQFSSIYGMLGQDPALYENIMSMKESMTYSVIKGGITNSVRSMAAYYGKYKIRINAVCPGGVLDKQNKSFVERYKKKTPIQRMATPEDISNATIFLASEKSSYITGTNLIVDGGFSII